MALDDILRFIFESSQVDADVASSLEEAAALDRHKSRKTPLLKALKTLGIPTDGMAVDEDGCWLTLTDSEAYHNALKALGSVEAVNDLADLGWVCTNEGDVADTAEPEQYVLNFLLLDEPNVSAQDKPTPVDKLNKEFEKGSDAHEAENITSVDESANAVLEALKGRETEKVPASLAALAEKTGTSPTDWVAPKGLVDDDSWPEGDHWYCNKKTGAWVCVYKTDIDWFVDGDTVIEVPETGTEPASD